MSVGMSLVISSGFGFDRITCVYAGSESRKSIESSSKTSRKGRPSSGRSRVPRAANRSKVVAKLVARGDHLRAALMDSVFLTLKTAEKRLVAACMQSEREPRRRMHEMVAGPVHSREEW